eukprot:TRINITY_DN21998_c0_g2_i1.p1 TRINITY_DN21998_c0_g2~~TRINITY_DN21998_c0_g2_i1.p1  ORF type:complete len:1551 (+),score=381.55 TRINITY_DN21998_c0_g2_i1:60-4655(+)
MAVTSESPRKKAKTNGHTAPVREIPVIGGSVVYVGNGLLRKIPSEITAKGSGIKASRFVIVSDRTVFGLYGQILVDAFKECGHTPLTFQIPPGENSKHRRVKEQIEDYMLANKCQRDTCLVALGGGVVGDLTGYVAATFMRGVPVVQVPTSMMAMIDSSVGGKTAINVPAGKNLVGSFHQPQRVYADMDLLKSLHEREVNEGLAEAVKMGLIRSKKLFELMEDHVDAIRALEPEVTAQVVHQAVGLKAEVVALDEKETGLRSTLNFGHTIGHAIEGLASPALLHGECVSIGMVYEAILARDLGYLPSAAVGRITRVLKSYSLPVEIPQAYHRVPEMMNKMAVDKKNLAGNIRCTILTGVGTSFDEPKPVGKAIFEQLLSPRLTVLPQPKGVAGTVHVPGSKSISNRVLLMAAMGTGKCRISGLLHSDDSQVMINALQAMGAGPFVWEENGAVLQMEGLGGRFVTPKEPMYLGNAGTAARFLTTCAALIKEDGKHSVLTGDKRMKERPIKDLTDALALCGCKIEHMESPTSLPVKVSSTGLKGGRIELSGKVSSQFVSSVLISAPYAQTPVELVLKEKPVSQSYIDMTTSLMAQFGVKVERVSETVYKIPKTCYKNPEAVLVECDASSATYPLAFAAISGGTVTCEAVGSTSIQGDAKFAMLLRDMGCTIKQDASNTTVTGPAKGKRLKAIDVDMEPMTDAFMTAVAVMAVAEGTSKITGIANQRVKECNRINVMVTELAKLGITAGELEDGIWVTGVDPEKFKANPAVISCHNDHRIAMSFAVLGSRVAGITIGQKSCVEKTYPEFWSDTSRKLGMEYEATDAKAAAGGAKGGVSDATIVLIGMRGAGKTHLGTALARSLGRPFIDMDHAYEAKHGKIMDTVNKEGWPIFRQREVELLRTTLAEKPTGAVIACGGGIVETDAGRAALRAHWPVVQAMKPIEDVEAYLGADASRPSLGEPPRKAYERRAPWYSECADFDLVAAAGETDWVAQEARLERLVKRAMGLETPAPLPHAHSFFLSLTFPDLSKALPAPAELWSNIDCVEFRADLLQEVSPGNIQKQLALLRRHCPLPVLFTVRSKAQGGAFTGKFGAYMELNTAALRMGVEWIDLEAAHDGPELQTFCGEAARRGVRIIGSHHEVSGMPATKDIQASLRRCQLQGSAHVAKFVGMAKDHSHALQVHTAAATAELTVPHIALAMGGMGQMSRVLNTYFTPVTHPLLQVAAAPGQMSAAQILDARRAVGYLPASKFFIFGSPTKHSPSPSMHNAGFRTNGTSHTYGVCETDNVDVALRQLREPGVGGGSVTIPLKEQLMPHVGKKSEAVTTIGSLNTLTVTADGEIEADNTDWVGIKVLLADALAARGKASAPDLVALVMGGGGTARAACYALKQLGVASLYVYNRTSEKADDLCSSFGGRRLADLKEGTAALQRLDIVVSCVPGSAQLTLPVDFLRQKSPIVLDAAYRPRETPFLKDAAAAGCLCIEGIEMLFEQGCAQCEIWTHRAAPRSDIARGMAAFLQEQEFGPLPKRLRELQ